MGPASQPAWITIKNFIQISSVVKGAPPSIPSSLLLLYFTGVNHLISFLSSSSSSSSTCARIASHFLSQYLNRGGLRRAATAPAAVQLTTVSSSLSLSLYYYFTETKLKTIFLPLLLLWNVRRKKYRRRRVASHFDGGF